jgi:hypothetical protein
MNPIDEAITKCQQTASLLESDILQAYNKACNIVRDSPCGASKRDNALIAYLAERLAAIRKLQSDLLNLG